MEASVGGGGGTGFADGAGGWAQQREAKTAQSANGVGRVMSSMMPEGTYGEIEESVRLPIMSQRLAGPLDAVRRMVAVSRSRPAEITPADIRSEIARLKREYAMIGDLIRALERLARLRYEDTATSKRGPKVR